MESSFPNSVSTSDLQSYLDALRSDINWGGCSEAEIVAICQRHFEQSYDDCKSPMVHKVLCLMIIRKFLEWHQTLAAAHAKDGNTTEAGLAMTDFGRLTAAYDLIRSVEVDDQDFTAGSVVK